MIDRITKNWRTTTFAILIFAVLAVVLWKDYATWTEASGWVILALDKLFSNDGSTPTKNSSNS